MLTRGESGLLDRLLARIHGMYFATKWNQDDQQQTSYGGLEVADLCAYPLRRSRLAPDDNGRDWSIVQTKLVGHVIDLREKK